MSVHSVSSDVSEAATNGTSPACSISSFEEETLTVVCFAEECVEAEPATCTVEQMVQEETMTSATMESIVEEDETTVCVSEKFVASEEIAVTELAPELSVADWEAEASVIEFEVVTVDSCEDNVSMCSVGSTDDVVQTHEVVMECDERIVEEVPTSPYQKILIRRR